MKKIEVAKRCSLQQLADDLGVVLSTVKKYPKRKKELMLIGLEALNNTESEKRSSLKVMIDDFGLTLADDLGVTLAAVKKYPKRKKELMLIGLQTLRDVNKRNRDVIES